MFALSTLVALGLILTAPNQANPTLPKQLDGVHTIVCLGDSITQQGESPGGYVWLLRHYLNTLYPKQGIKIVNAGISGHKSTDMLKRYQADVIDKHPDLIFISVGVNDVWHGFYDGHTNGDGPLGIPLPEYRAHVKEMIDGGKAAGAKVDLLLATLIGEDVQAPENIKAIGYNNTLRDLAKETNSGLVDLQTPFREIIGAYRSSTGSTQNFLTVDGVHMNALGNQIMTQTILTSLGVPDKDRKAAVEEIEKQLQASRPHPGPMPTGAVLSDDKPTQASSVYSDQYGPKEANASGKAFDQRWCAANGNYQPNPWWLVDLGSSHTLNGIHIEFAPEDPDTWRYKVQVSDNGTDYHDIVDRSAADQYFSVENHRFPASTTGRFVRILFTGQTSAQNWASLRHVQVYGTQ